VARAARACAQGLGENTRNKLIRATRAGHGDTKLVLPIESAPGVAPTEKELKLLVGRKGFRLGEVNEAVEGKLDLVTKFVGAPHNSVKGFASLHGVSGWVFA